MVSHEASSYRQLKGKQLPKPFLQATFVPWYVAEVLYVYSPISSHRALKRHVLEGWDLIKLIFFSALVGEGQENDDC